jgi:predicted dienelactone hydrolase
MLLRLLGLLICLAIVTGACGGDDDATAPPGESPPASTNTVQEPTVTPSEAVAIAPDQLGPYSVGVTLTEYNKTSTTGQNRSIDVVIWYPSDDTGVIDEGLQAILNARPSTDAPFPLIVFSHGSGGNPRQSRYLTVHLASHGFVVAALSHPGNTTEDCFPCRDFNQLADSYANRPLDVAFVRDQLIAASLANAPPLGGVIDASSIGLSGHSFGGYTTVAGLANGGWDAGAAMAPVDVVLPNFGSAASIEVPLLVFGGALDQTTPFAMQQAIYDAASNAPVRLLIQLPNGGHMAFSDFCLSFAESPSCTSAPLDAAEGHDLINLYLTAFFRYYLNGEEQYRNYLLSGNEPSDEVAVVAESGLE